MASADCPRRIALIVTTYNRPDALARVLAGCGAQTDQAFDVIVADDDGVCIVPRKSAASVAKRAAIRASKEEEKRARLGSGELGLDMYDMRGRLAEAGLEYLDSLEDLAD